MKVVQDLKWYQLKSVEDLKIVEKDGGSAWQYFNMLETLRHPCFLELAVMRAIHNQNLQARTHFLGSTGFAVCGCSPPGAQGMRYFVVPHLAVWCLFAFLIQFPIKQTRVQSCVPLWLLHNMFQCFAGSRHVQRAQSGSFGPVAEEQFAAKRGASQYADQQLGACAPCLKAKKNHGFLGTEPPTNMIFGTCSS